MGHSAFDQPLNLGLYSIRSPDHQSSLRVGSIWRRKRLATKDNESSASSSNHDNTTPKCDCSSSKPLDLVKRRRSISSTSRSEELSQTTANSRSSANNNDDGYLGIRASTTGQNTFVHPDGPPEQELTTQVTIGREDGANKFASFGMPASPIALQPHSSEGPISVEAICINVTPNFLRSNSTMMDFSSSGTSERLSSIKALSTSSELPRANLKVYPKQRAYNSILSGVTFVMSGYENPRRSRLKELAMKMGAKYRAKWEKSSCTHLICAFKHTPKYVEVMFKKGRIVREHWIQECSRQRQLLDWRNYKLGKYPYPDSEEDGDDEDDCVTGEGENFV